MARFKYKLVSTILEKSGTLSENFEILKNESESVSALSSISLPTERAPPSTFHLHTKFNVMLLQNWSFMFSCPLSIIPPILFNLFLERILGDALERFEGGVSCAGVRIKELRFADDIDLLDESEEGIIELTERLENTSRRY